MQQLALRTFQSSTSQKCHNYRPPRLAEEIRDRFMTQTYEYNGYTLQIAVESDFQYGHGTLKPRKPGYVAVVRICESGSLLSRFSPLRLGENTRRPFVNESDALNGGYRAACTIVDDLFQPEVN
jgi:hypothetical protein